ncbi:MAG: DASH family cryptochrome [Methylophilaceae bacterium]|nr:DASH family cryptochrome [Methylophilaceae bacterium]
MKSIYWFRNDLRINDNHSLNLAIDRSDKILFVYIHDIANKRNCSWGFKRVGEHRNLFLSQGLIQLKNQLNKYGHSLNTYVEDPVNILCNLVNKHKIDTIFCESILSFDELKQIELLNKKGVTVCSLWHSSLLDKDQLPFSILNLPNNFTDFRKVIELKGIKPYKPIVLSKRISKIYSIDDKNLATLQINSINYDKSSFPLSNNEFMGGEQSGLIFLKNYFKGEQPSTYKKTRNQLMGKTFSTKFSPWLSLGYLSARQIFYFLNNYEKTKIKNESTYWIFFELLWRDYFRFIFEKFGKKMFYKKGLNFSSVEVKHSIKNFNLWTSGQTKNQFINAGMFELNSTGFLSNRMRQIVASYLINELSCDWRAGAAWFESQLIDYDVYSNHCNWAYIAGCGTDPRGGRHFNVDKQREIHDPQYTYQNLWAHS